jgi:uracil-DNA glycosylase
VHRVLEELGAERRVILWNTVPTHPHRPDVPLSNRRPTVVEVELGAAFARRLIALVRPATVVAVGRIAESVLGAEATYVRHPANAGGPAFAAGMRAILGA